jgi:hypothetical protein
VLVGEGANLERSRHVFTHPFTTTIRKKPTAIPSYILLLSWCLAGWRDICGGGGGGGGGIKRLVSKAV